jgi:hypothetical protein
LTHIAGKLAVFIMRQSPLQDFCGCSDEEVFGLGYNFNFPHVPFGTDPQ